MTASDPARFRPLQRLLAVGLALVLVSTGCSTPTPARPLEQQAGDYRYTLAHTRWLIDREMADNKVTGLSIALVDDQHVVWAEGFGHEDAESRQPATSQTPYRLGSIAKVLTATAAMQLAEQGRLDIDRPLSDALPGFSVRSRYDRGGDITPRNIMHHHSGLPSNYLRGMLTTDTPEPFTRLVSAVQDEYVAYPPDFIFSYSNLAVTLLGAAIERIAGQPYESHLAASLFEPLGMTQTRFDPKPALKVYDKHRPIEPLALRDLPSGGLVSTVDDMSRFMRWVFAEGRVGERELLGAGSLAEMLRPQNTQIPLDMGFRVGLGWLLSGIEIRNAGTVASHGGTLLDSHSMMVILPDHKLGVIVASNSASSQGVVKTIATEVLKLALEAKTGIRQPDPLPTAQDEVVLPREHLESYAAWYDSMVGLIRVDPGSNALDARVMGHTLQLKPRASGQFGLRYKLFGMIPVQVSAFDGIRVSRARVAGHNVLVGHFGDDTMLVGEQLRPTPVPQRLLDFVGEYEVVGQPLGIMPDRLALRLEDGMLVGECTFSQLPGFVLRVGLKPLSDSELLIQGLGTGKGETIIASNQGEERVLLFSGLELRKKLN